MSLPAFTTALLLIGGPGQMSPDAVPVALTSSQAAPAEDEPPRVPATPTIQDQVVFPVDVRLAVVAATPVAVQVQATHHPRVRTAGDPLEGFNRRMFAAQQAFDKAVLRPAARGYAHVAPKPVRSGLRHFFSNLSEPIVFLNYLLQLKPGKAAETLARFVIDTGLGFGGLLDTAKTPGINLPHRSNGFGDTLAFYGVKPGPYLFLPLVGPTTLRDFVGGQADGLVLPLAIGKPFNRLEYQVPRAIVTGLDRRAEADDDLRALFDGAVDPYATLRSAYLQDRESEIRNLKGGDTTTPELQDPLDDPAGTHAAEPPSDPLAELKVDSSAEPLSESEAPKR